MGLFGSAASEGWLANLFCCWPALYRAEEPFDSHYPSRGPARGDTYGVEHSICNQQPLPLTAFQPVPVPHHWDAIGYSNGVDSGENIEQPTRPLNRPPSLKPLEFGDSLFIGHRQPYDQRGNSPAVHKKRPSIGAPTSFRRLEYTEGQRVSLIPLRLGPIVLDETPPPQPEPQICRPPSYISADVADHVLKRADSTRDSLSKHVDHDSYPELRDTPFERAQKTGVAATSQPRSQSEHTLSSVPGQVRERASRLTMSTQSSSASLRRQAIESNAVSAYTRSSSREPSRERPALKRKLSLQSMRKPYVEAGSSDVDKEILELNTIVEEKRNEAVRSTTPDEHRPAVAPTMQVRARSETLTDIGSAFSRPHTSRDTMSSPAFFSELEQRQLRRTTSNRGTRSRSSSRVSGWLSSLLPSSSSTSQSHPEPFYKCLPQVHTRAHSERSLCSFATELDSPALTLASSPTSKGHSRSITAESRLTVNLATPLPVYAHPDGDSGKGPSRDPSPIIMASPSPSQVGLAL